MAISKNQIRAIIAGGAAVLVGILVWSSIQQTRQQYEVCLTFKGVMHCATAAGATSSDAIRSAHDIDCAMLANGRDENMVCTDVQPSSVRQVK
jgi:hypothetical protein